MRWESGRGCLMVWLDLNEMEVLLNGIVMYGVEVEKGLRFQELPNFRYEEAMMGFGYSHSIGDSFCKV